MTCEWHLCSNQLTGRQKKFCSIGCKTKKHVSQKRRNNKKRLVEALGGECVICGYNKSVAALQFHHKNDNKSFGISASGTTKAYEKLLLEAQKCELICANCHFEHHYG